MAFIMSTLLVVACSLHFSHGCVTSSGPSWELGDSGPPGILPAIDDQSGTAGRPGPVGPSQPGIPTEVLQYVAGDLTKEAAFSGLDLNSDGQVSADEWGIKGGSASQFTQVLAQLDVNGDSQISLTELELFGQTPILAPSLKELQPMERFRGVPRGPPRGLPGIP